jgi:hypothetical protein
MHARWNALTCGLGWASAGVMICNKHEDEFAHLSLLPALSAQWTVLLRLAYQLHNLNA